MDYNRPEIKKKCLISQLIRMSADTDMHVVPQITL